MSVDYSFDDKQAEPDARFVEPPRTVGFVKPVEDQGYLVGRYADAGVVNRYAGFLVVFFFAAVFVLIIIFIVVFGYIYFYQPLFGRELDGVLEKVVQDLPDRHGVGRNVYLVAVRLKLKLKMLFFYFLTKVYLF